MLTRMRLKGFKSWRDTGEVELRPITGLFGANSSGKTSLLQALLLLKQTADSPDRATALRFGDHRTPMHLGSFLDAAHGHKARETLDIALDWDTDSPMEISDLSAGDRIVAESDHLGFQTQVGYRNGGNGASTYVKEMAYRVGDAQFGMRRKSGGKPEYQLRAQGGGKEKFRFVRVPGKTEFLPAPIRCYGFPNQVRAYHQNAGFVLDLEFALASCLDRVHYLGPLREAPQRVYSWNGAQPTDVGLRGEHFVDAILASDERGDTIARGRGGGNLSLEKYVAWWLKKLKLAHEFRVKPIAPGVRLYEVRVRRFPTSPEVLITDVGFGVPQILPVLVLCFYVPEGSTIILEHPEMHLHATAQSGLADVLIDAHKKRGVQILVESHSEHLLYRLQRRVAEKKITTREIGLHFCKASGSNSTLTPLNVDPRGIIQNWPKDFFGDPFGEISATRKAGLKHSQETET